MVNASTFVLWYTAIAFPLFVIGLLTTHKDEFKWDQHNGWLFVFWFIGVAIVLAVGKHHGAVFNWKVLMTTYTAHAGIWLIFFQNYSPYRTRSKDFGFMGALLVGLSFTVGNTAFWVYMINSIKTHH